MKGWFQRDSLDRVLAQEFGHTWATSRKAVNRYYVEAFGRVPQWFDMCWGNKYAIAEWIEGTDRYWVPVKQRWTTKFPEDWPPEWKWRDEQTSEHQVSHRRYGRR